MARTLPSIRRASHARPTLVAAAAVSAGLLLAACGGGDDEAEVVESSSTTEADATTTTASGSINALPSGVEVDTTVWFRAFEIGLSDPTLNDEDPDAPVLEIEVQLDNLAESSQGLSAGDVQLWLGDEQTVRADFDGQSIPSLGSGTGTLSFDLDRVDGDLDLTEAEIRFGTEAQNQAIVPLDGEDVVTLEPVEFEVGESTSVGTFSYEFTDGLIQYNDVKRGRPLDEGAALLTLTYDADLAAGDYAASRSVLVAEWRLTLPDGSQVAYEDNTGDTSIPTGTNVTGHTVTYEIVRPVGGDYVLAIVSADEEGDNQTGDLPFTVPDQESSDADEMSTTTTTES